MANIVTFDIDRLLIIEIGVLASPLTSPETFADNVITMQEVYSEWKEFAAQTAGSPSTGSLGIPPAIRQVGGDPTSDTEGLGITYFLTNGWRFKGAEGHHRLQIDGNVYTDPAGQSISIPVDGPYTVNVENKVSNLIDGITALTTIDENTALLPGMATEIELMAALIAGDAEVSTDDLTVTLYETSSPFTSPRTIKAQYAISADGRIRRRLV